mgnify:CR=1 FL=1
MQSAINLKARRALLKVLLGRLINLAIGNRTRGHVIFAAIYLLSFARIAQAEIGPCARARAPILKWGACSAWVARRPDQHVVAQR